MRKLTRALLIIFVFSLALSMPAYAKDVPFTEPTTLAQKLANFIVKNGYITINKDAPPIHKYTISVDEHKYVISFVPYYKHLKIFHWWPMNESENKVFSGTYDGKNVGYYFDLCFAEEGSSYDLDGSYKIKFIEELNYYSLQGMTEHQLNSGEAAFSGQKILYFNKLNPTLTQPSKEAEAFFQSIYEKYLKAIAKELNIK